MMWLLAISDFCSRHPAAARCNDHSSSVAVVEIVVVALIAVLIVTELVWTFWVGSRGPIAHLALFIARLFRPHVH